MKNITIIAILMTFITFSAPIFSKTASSGSSVSVTVVDHICTVAEVKAIQACVDNGEDVAVCKAEVPCIMK